MGNIDNMKKLSVVTYVDATATLPAGGFLDVRSAAKFLGVSRQTVRTFIARGALTATTEAAPGPAKFQWMIPTEDLNRLKSRSS